MPRSYAYIYGIYDVRSGSVRIFQITVVSHANHSHMTQFPRSATHEQVAHCHNFGLHLALPLTTLSAEPWSISYPDWCSVGLQMFCFRGLPRFTIVFRNSHHQIHLNLIHTLQHALLLRQLYEDSSLLYFGRSHRSIKNYSFPASPWR